MHKAFNTVRSNTFTYPIVNMAAYAEINRVGKLFICSDFLKFKQYCHETSNLKNNKKKSKHVFFRKF